MFRQGDLLLAAGTIIAFVFDPHPGVPACISNPNAFPILTNVFKFVIKFSRESAAAHMSSMKSRAHTTKP